MSSTDDSFDPDSPADDLSSDDSDGDSTKKASKRAAKASVATTATSKILELKLESLEKCVQDYRENAKKCSVENSALENQLRQTEKDAIDVITFLKKEDTRKDEIIEKLNAELGELTSKFERSKSELVADYHSQRLSLQHALEEKDDEIANLHRQFNTLRDFQKGRQEMQDELEQIRQNFLEAKEHHRNTIFKMENRILLEKTKLEEVAQQRLSEVAAKAYGEALGSLQSNVKKIYEENINLVEALQYHAKEQSNINQEMARLKKSKEQLGKELNTKDKILKKNLLQVQSVKAEVISLEKANKQLSDQVLDLKRRQKGETYEVVKALKKQVDGLKAELSTCKKINSPNSKMIRNPQSHNMNEFKDDVGQFLMAALDDVRRLKRSKNSRFRLKPSGEETENEQVYYQKMSWEEKELVLRSLFSRWNTSKRQTPSTTDSSCSTDYS